MSEDPNDNIIFFPGETRLAIPASQLLEAALRQPLESVVVIGLDAEGRVHGWWSHATDAEAYFLLSRGAAGIIKGDDK